VVAGPERGARLAVDDHVGRPALDDEERVARGPFDRDRVTGAVGELVHRRREPLQLAVAQALEERDVPEALGASARHDPIDTSTRAE
jgi:hypothetical protein